MPTAVTLNFAPRTDPVTAFPNVAAWNAFFASFNFTLSSANIPVATSADYGSVKKSISSAATVSTWTSTTYGSNYYIDVSAYDIGGNVYSAQVVTKASFDAAVNNINQLKALYDVLVVNMQNAGLMNT